MSTKLFNERGEVIAELNRTALDEIRDVVVRRGVRELADGIVKNSPLIEHLLRKKVLVSGE
jgi:hypothetical protein